MNGPGQVSGTRAALLTLVVVVAVLKIAQDVFVPLGLAILLTFLLAPLVQRLQYIRVNRGVAVLVSLAFGLALAGAMGDLVVNQVTDLARSLPGYQRQLRHNIGEVRGVLSGGVSDTTKAVEELTREFQRVAPAEPRTPGVTKVQIIETPATAFTTLRDLIGPMLKPVGMLLVVIVLVAFMLLRLPDLRERVIRVLGARNLQVTTEALDDAASRISRYLLMQLLINAWTGLWVTFGLWLIGVPNAALWGVLTLLLRFIPYVGILAAAAMPFVLSFAAFDDWTRPLEVLGMFAVLELFSYSVLEPWLYGSNTGLSPVALLLAAAFWTWVWGFAGLFLAVPLTVCVAVMGKYIPQLHFLYVLLGDQPVLEPYERLYHRLLASGRDQADLLLEEVLRSHSILEVCDACIVPTMQLVESDFDRGALAAPRREMVLQHINDWAEERFDSLERSRAHRKNLASGTLPIVICVPAADKADEIIAKLLAAALLENGLDAVAGGVEAIDAEVRAAAGQGRLRAAIVSALPPHAVAPARTVAKRIRLSSAELPVFVGIWNDRADLQRAQERLETAGVTRVVTSFADCLTAVMGAAVPEPVVAVQPRSAMQVPLTQT
jgi:predicted PurR-regulated permease PerM